MNMYNSMYLWPLRVQRHVVETSDHYLFSNEKTKI